MGVKWELANMFRRHRDGGQILDCLSVSGWGAMILQLAQQLQEKK